MDVHGEIVCRCSCNNEVSMEWMENVTVYNGPHGANCACKCAVAQMYLIA